LFSEEFEFRKNTLANFVGGGGKTALIHRLMDEYSAGGTILYTTTTRIHPPKPSEGLVVISSDNLPLLKMMVERVGASCPSRPYKLVVTRHFMAPDLLQGVPPDFDNSLDRHMFPILLNEADGSARYSIKLPREGEPVLMEKADYLVPVIGIDCLNQPLGPKVVFRFQNLADLFSLRAGELMTPEIAAGILMHRSGVCKDWKAGATIVPFINKVDEPGQDAAARELATAILNNRNFPVKRVVFGSVLRGRVNSIRLP
jgi:probable selenium-dependent hydroxylase accessory protein YqeC